MDSSVDGNPVVLFDGYCNLCCGFAGWAIRRDSDGALLFAPLQGETAKKLLREMGYTDPPTDSVMLIEDGRLLTRSSAVLKILRHLGRPWRWLYPLAGLPRPLRDLCYDLVARVRYTVFGRRSSCRTPRVDDGDRMLP